MSKQVFLFSALRRSKDLSVCIILDICIVFYHLQGYTCIVFQQTSEISTAVIPIPQMNKLMLRHVSESKSQENPWEEAQIHTLVQILCELFISSILSIQENSSSTGTLAFFTLERSLRPAEMSLSLPDSPGRRQEGMLNSSFDLSSQC